MIQQHVDVCNCRWCGRATESGRVKSHTLEGGGGGGGSSVI